VAVSVQSPPLADPVAEGVRIVNTARQQGLEVYLLGGVAIAARRPAHVPAVHERRFNDVDIITSRSAGREIKQFLVALGYEEDHEFNVVNGRTRMLFHDGGNDRDLDVLIGEFAMCHEIAVLEEAVADQLTIPLADLLLTKLQIVELNEKDLWDVYNLLNSHSCSAEDDSEAINTSRIADMCSRDWGLWRTVTGNLAELARPERLQALPADAREVVQQRVGALVGAIDGAKKSRRWTIRGRIGDRVQWYEEPEEVH
jgi:Uncharacterised nucleotidyltransferase